MVQIKSKQDPKPPAKTRWQRLFIRLGLLIGLGLLLRLLPYLAPITAQDLVQQQQAISFQDRHGADLGTLLTRDQEHTVAVSLDQVAPQFRQAIIAAEDGRFYHHGPLDLLSIGRALRDNLQNRRVVSGASSITMQLARMIHPVSANLGGKLQEVWLAWRLGAGMNHDQILQAYINRLPMGGNIYGVEAAARVYFGIPARDLTLSQASLLAGLPNDPTRLNPYDNLAGLKQRQAYVLEQMVKDGYLTFPQAQAAANQIVSLQPRDQGLKLAPHFLFWLADQLPTYHPPVIQTSLDADLQQFVAAQVGQIVRSLRSHNGHQAAALVIENATGAVLAYVGSPDYFGSAPLNKNDGVQALRQPGSTLKPFLYQLALENRTIRSTTILADVATHYAIPGAQLYSPQDYNERYHGPVRVRQALGNSLNIPAVRVLEQVGVANLLQRLQNLGFRHLNHSPEYYGLGLTLGSGEVSLWELAQAYLLIARHGQFTPLQTQLPIPDAPTSPPVQIGTASTWSLITDILSDAHARARAFGVDSVLSLPFPAAVKTGTSSDYRDTWTVGFSRNYTVATWVGNFNGEPMRKVSGVTGAAPLWQRIMLHLHQTQEPVNFEPPAGMIERPICAISGYKPNPGCPVVVQEYIDKADLANYEQQADPIVQLISTATGQPRYRLNLPPEYDSWLANQPDLLAMRNPSQASAGSLRIAFPREGDYFLLPTNPATPPKLEFKLTQTPKQPVTWFLNGKPFGQQTGSSLFWPLQVGQWRLQIQSSQAAPESTSQTIDEVNFEVQPANATPTRRGFTVKE